jgi:hypothetical protein
MRLRDELANGLVGFPVLLLMLGIAVPHRLAGRAPLQLLLPAAHLADCASLLRLMLLQQMLHPCYRMIGSGLICVAVVLEHKRKNRIKNK